MMELGGCRERIVGRRCMVEVMVRLLWWWV